MNQLPERSHLDKARDKINERLMSMVENDKELNLVALLTSYHIDMDIYIEALEKVVIDSQEEYLKVRKTLDSLKKSYDMVLDAYKKTSDQEIKNMYWILKKRNEQSRNIR